MTYSRYDLVTYLVTGVDCNVIDLLKLTLAMNISTELNTYMN